MLSDRSRLRLLTSAATSRDRRSTSTPRHRLFVGRRLLGRRVDPGAPYPSSHWPLAKSQAAWIERASPMGRLVYRHPCLDLPTCFYCASQYRLRKDALGFRPWTLDRLAHSCHSRCRFDPCCRRLRRYPLVLSRHGELLAHRREQNRKK